MATAQPPNPQNRRPRAHRGLSVRLTANGAAPQTADSPVGGLEGLRVTKQSGTRPGWRLEADPAVPLPPDVSAATARNLTGWNGQHSDIYPSRIDIQAHIDRVQAAVLTERKETQ